MAGLVLGLVQFMVADDRATHHEVDEAQQDEADDGHHDHRLEVLHEELVLERPGALLELRAAVLQGVGALLQSGELRIALKSRKMKKRFQVQGLYIGRSGFRALAMNPARPDPPATNMHNPPQPNQHSLLLTRSPRSCP